MKAARRTVEITDIFEAGTYEVVLNDKGVWLRRKGARVPWKYVPWDEVWYSTRPVAERPGGGEDDG